MAVTQTSAPVNILANIDLELVFSSTSSSLNGIANSPKITKASYSLVKRIEIQKDSTKINKPSLLDDQDDENKSSYLDVPLWLIVTAKERIATSHTLKPAKISAPHTLYSSPATRICLITADPPASNAKVYKSLVQDSQFPQDLRTKIRKVIRYSKLAKKYKSYESRRQLLAEYDVFLADERVVHLIPMALGSVFYKSTTKRPIAVSLTGKELKKEKKTPLERLKAKKKGAADDGPTTIGKPEDVGRAIETALSTMVVNLSPSTSTSIKVAYAGWPSEWVSANVSAAIERVVTKYVPGQWDGLKSLHLKGPETASLPIYMAEKIWNDDRVLDEGETVPVIENSKKTKSKSKKGKEQLIDNDMENLVIQDADPNLSKKRKLEKDSTVPKKKTKLTKKSIVVESSTEAEASNETRKKKAEHKKLIEEVAKQIQKGDESEPDKITRETRSKKKKRTL